MGQTTEVLAYNLEEVFFIQKTHSWRMIVMMTRLKYAFLQLCFPVQAELYIFIPLRCVQNVLYLNDTEDEGCSE